MCQKITYTGIAAVMASWTKYTAGVTRYEEIGLSKVVAGYGVPVPTGNIDLGASAFTYTPPISGSLLTGFSAAQCAWPPPSGTYGAVLCNLQFAFMQPTGAGCPCCEPS